MAAFDVHTDDDHDGRTGDPPVHPGGDFGEHVGGESSLGVAPATAFPRLGGDLADPGPDGGVAYDDEFPGLAILGVRGVDGGVEELRDGGVVDRVVPELAVGALAPHHLECVGGVGHGPTVYRTSSPGAWTAPFRSGTLAPPALGPAVPRPTTGGPGAYDARRVTDPRHPHQRRADTEANEEPDGDTGGDFGRVADRRQLRELVEAYALAADSGDPAAVAALFTPSGRLVVHHDPDRPGPTGTRSGHDEITAAIATLSRYRATSHVVGAHRVELDGDRATGEATGLAYQVLADGESDPMMVVLGIRYVDDYVRHCGEWRFAARHVVVRWREERPLSPGERA